GPRGAERDRGDDRVRAQLGLGVGVVADRVLARAVVVAEQAVERRGGGLLDAAAEGGEVVGAGARLVGGAAVGVGGAGVGVVGGQARQRVAERAALLRPRGAVLQGGEEGVGLVARQEVGRVQQHAAVGDLAALEGGHGARLGWFRNAARRKNGCRPG